METLNIQISIDGPNCTLVNRQLKKLETPPAIVRGVPITLALKLCNAKYVEFFNSSKVGIQNSGSN